MKTKVLILLLSIPFLCFGQHRFSHLNIEDGLTENSVTDIFQDSEGYIWFSTQDGISQYDGYQFKNYNISNNSTTSLSDNYLWGFTEDSLGYIWVCSRNGLNRIDKRTGTVVQFLRDSLRTNGTNQVASIVEHQGRILALIHNKVYKIQIKASYNNSINYIDDHSAIETNADTIYALYKKEDDIYFIRNNGLFNFTMGKQMLVPDFHDGITHTFLKATQSKNVIWFTNGRKVYTHHIKSETTSTLTHDFRGAIIYDLLAVENELWVATDNGVFVFNRDQLVFHITKKPDNNKGVSSNFIAALFQDNAGKIWIGTAGNGINVYDSKLDRFKYLSKETFGDEYIVRSVVQTSADQLIVCSSNDLFVLDLHSPQMTRNKFARENVAAVRKLDIKGYDEVVPTKVALGSGGDILVGTKGNEIIVLDEHLIFKKQITLNKEQQPTNVISDIILTRSGKFWVATYYGVYVLDKEYHLTEVFLPQEKGLTSNYFLSVFEDKENSIWLGSNVGIFKFDEHANKFKQYAYQKNNLERSPGFNFVCGFADFGDGHLWMATYGGGLSKMKKETEVFEHFTTENGLNNNVCNGLLVDSLNRIWLNTNRGLSVYDTRHNSFVNYTKHDGLHFNEFNLNSFYKNASGEFMFGTPIGLVIFNPVHIGTSIEPSPVVITGIDINYKNEKQRLKDNIIHLFPEDKAFTIHYAGLSFSKSPKIKYAYKLEGYNEDWVETNELKANYTSLPDGEYTFLLRATNDDGIWNVLPHVTYIIVHPPYYKTWWFITISVLVILILTSLIIRYFAQRNIKKRLRELRIQQEINQEKQRISRDLHDNIGAQITYLISSIDQESYTIKEHHDVFDQLSDKARNVMTQLRQTIWLISKESISLSDFSRKVRDYSTKILSASKINMTLTVNGNVDALMSPTVVSHLFRIIQEAQNNIIKHAKASSVEITIHAQDNVLKLSVSDDGVGIGEIEKLDDHFGLKNMRDRTTELKGSFKIHHNSDSRGTEIVLEIPF